MICPSNTRLKITEVSGGSTKPLGTGATLKQSEHTHTILCTDKATDGCRAIYQKEWTETTTATSWPWTSNNKLQGQSNQKTLKGRPPEQLPQVHVRGVPLPPSTLEMRSLLWVTNLRRYHHHNFRHLSNAWSADSEERSDMDWTLTSSTLKTQ